jgi:hypothetical protein
VYGFKPEVPSALKETPSANYSYDDYVMELKGRLQTVHEIASQKLVSHKLKTKEYYKRREPVTLEVVQSVRKGKGKVVPVLFN